MEFFLPLHVSFFPITFHFLLLHVLIRVVVDRTVNVMLSSKLLLSLIYLPLNYSKNGFKLFLNTAWNLIISTGRWYFLHLPDTAEECQCPHRYSNYFGSNTMSFIINLFLFGIHKVHQAKLHGRLNSKGFSSHDT